MGDPAGVGPELCLRLLADPESSEHCTPIVFGDVATLAAAARACDLPAPAGSATFGDPAKLSQCDAPSVFDLGAVGEFSPGVVSAATGAAAFSYIEAAIEAALRGDVDAVTTGPIHKEALRAAGVPFVGHTEIFAQRTGATRYRMMLTSEAISCCFVTAHVGYRDVPSLLSVEQVVETIEIAEAGMTAIRGRQPRIVVCGLNPHAGEHGLFGAGEEETIIAPAVVEARRRGCQVEGPLPPDAAFVPERRRDTDCFVCMYHDQGHIPLKALAFDEAVNITLGLPIIRTSVDHGTALDVAWQGVAKPTSLLEALRLASRLASAASRDADQPVSAGGAAASV